jgi:beta-lactamase class A
MAALLTVTAQLKSLPSGVLQYESDGTQISVLDAATKMISISDNAATDMLINLVGPICGRGGAHHRRDG